MSNNVYARAIDVSHFQGDIDWAKVKASGITYAMAKATDGATNQDAKFPANFKGMKGNGIQAGAYHYYRALSSTPDDQFKNILSVLQQNGFQAGADLFAIDVEGTGNENATPDQMADNFYALLTKVRDGLLGGKWPCIYTSASIWNEKVNWQKYDFSVSPLWVAHWNVTEPRVPDTWKDKGWVLWQYTDKGQVDGIAGNVDLDNVNEAALRAA